MSDERIFLSAPDMGGAEIKYIEKAFSDNWISPSGPNLDLFEQKIKDYTKTQHVVALSSGTAALHLALILLGVGSNDEVVCSSFTFSASANPICYLGASPVFIDSEKESWNMDPNLLEQAIKDRLARGKKPKAIVLVHLYGMPAKMDAIVDLANKYGIPLIEDAAEALGSTYKGQMLGTFGDFGIYSFNGNKIITTSGGGALISSNKEAIDQARFLSTQARDKAPHYQHSHIGYNYRLSNVSAGIGCGQMEVLDDRVAKRRANYAYYQEALRGASSVQFLNEPKEYFSNRWLTCIALSNPKTSREDIQKHMELKNIEVRPLWKPLHLQPIFQKFDSYLSGVSESLFKTGLCLPSGSALQKKELDKVIGILKELL